MRSVVAALMLFISSHIGLPAAVASARGTLLSGPVARDPEGRRAYDDLGRFYADPPSTPPYDEALGALESASPVERRAGGRYLLRLFEQSLADEANGRAQWVQTPYFGGGASSRARELRESLAESFGKRATAEEALPALEWLLKFEPVPDFQAEGARALGRMRGPATVQLLGRLMREPHPSGPVLREAIQAARSQSLRSLIPEVRRLALDYRESVRQAAREALVAMGGGEAPPWQPSAGFPAWLGRDLRGCAARVWTPVPRDAQWSFFRVETNQMYRGRPFVGRISGWLLAEEDTTYRVLSEFGREEVLSRRRTRVVPQSLEAEAARIVALRRTQGSSDADMADSLSVGGGLTGQFEPNNLSLPEILLAAWSFERGDTASVAALLYPRIDALGHDRMFDAIARDLLGNLHHQQMLEAFSYDRDYARTMALAEHLSRPIFDGYLYQPRARELRAQLAHRQSDFHGFALPDSMEWERQKRTLDRTRQIAYLSKRLRLLNCFQWGQPGGVFLAADQYEEPTHMSSPWDTVENRSRRLINPYRELTGMQLLPADLPSLAPALADIRFLPTFSFWRDFHPERKLYRVCDLAADLVNDVAQQRLVDPDSLPELTPQMRDKLVGSVSEWGRARAGESPADLRIELMKTTRSGYEFRTAAGAELGAGDPRATPILLERIGEFPNELVWLLKICSEAKTDAFVPLARKQLNAPAGSAERDWSAKGRVFYSGLILLRQGEPDGLAALRSIVTEDIDGYWMREAFGDLLASRDPEARPLLAGAARKPKLLLDRENSTMLRRLFREGLEGIADSLNARLESEAPHGKVYSQDDSTGTPIERSLVEGDAVAAYLAEWRPGGPRFDNLAPDAGRRRRREEIRLWLTEQARRVRAGEAVEMHP